MGSKKRSPAGVKPGPPDDGARRLAAVDVGTNSIRMVVVSVDPQTGGFTILARETGITLEIVSGPEEARLIYLGVLQALPVMNRRILLVDLGGGSTEFLVGKRRRVLYDNSLKIGAATPGLHDIRLSSVRHLAKKLKSEREHSERVAELALGIFDQTAHLHRCQRQDRELLEAAAMLHEVGLFISHERHHQHSIT
ncbi:MAG TPA: hypothetical protein VJO14_07460 [Bacteroidota bacterium]|nr:hypothetical protein [Bacteroidota bacterium]